MGQALGIYVYFLSRLNKRDDTHLCQRTAGFSELQENVKHVHSYLPEI